METRFKLEEQIMDCWHVTDDINVLFEAVCDEDITEDEVQNVLLGLKTLYHIKFQRLFSTFEDMIREDHRAIPERMCEAVFPRESCNCR